MTLGEMQTDLYDRLSYNASPDPAITRRLTRFINEAQRELVTMRGLARLRRSILTFASVASSPFAVLPQAAVRIAGIQDRSSQRSLKEISIQDLRFRDPGLTTLDSNPASYVIINMASPLAVEPSTADELFIKSASASDVGLVYLQGITAGGYTRLKSVTMTGVTALTFGPTDWIAVTKLYLATAAVGVVTLNQTSGLGTELSHIPIGATTPRYTRIQLYGTPTQALTYYADVDLHVEDLAIAGDTPYLPEDFQWLLPCGALRKEAAKRKDWDAYRFETARWTVGISDLKAFCRQTTDDGRPGGSQLSDFNGGYYPASPLSRGFA